MCSKFWGKPQPLPSLPSLPSLPPGVKPLGAVFREINLREGGLPYWMVFLLEVG